MVHAISGSLLCKIDLSKRECADVILFIQRYRLERDLDQTQIYLRRKKSNNSEVNLRLFLLLKTSFMTVVLKLGSTEPQGFGEAVAGVRLRSE